MKKKLIPILAMVVIAAICVGIVIVAHPAPKYEVDSKDTPVVMTVNGKDIHAREYASLLVYSKTYMDNVLQSYGMDSSIWTDPETKDQFFSQLQEQTKQQLVFIHTIIDQFEKNGLKLSTDKIREIENQKAALIERQGGEALFIVWLSTLGFDEQMYDNIMLVTAYSEALNDYYFGNNGKALPAQDQMVEYYKNNYIQAKHILIQTTDENGNPLTGEALKEKTDLANKVLEEAKSGKNFDELITEYNDDPGMSSNKDGYVFTKGDMVDEFYDAALNLGENEISDVVKTSYGYHIIKRLPLDETKISNFTMQIASGIEGKDVSFDALVQEWMEAAKVETNEEFDKITLDNVFDYIVTESSEDNQQDAAEDNGKSDAEPENDSQNTDAAA